MFLDDAGMFEFEEEMDKLANINQQFFIKKIKNFNLEYYCMIKTPQIRLKILIV